MKAIKSIGIIPNKEKDENLAFTREVIAWLSAKGCAPLLPEGYADLAGLEKFSCPELELYQRAEFLTVLGGDGTILSVARESATHGTPLLGINLGTLGYLTDVEKSDAFTALEKAIAGQYKLERRMMLTASIDGDKHGGKLLALNDVCVAKGAFFKMISLELYINGEYMDTIRADGLIFSTPTGSTAYNLSAGGPILKPDSQMIAVTPICPHSLYARPWVISAEDVITVKIAGPGECLLLMDGQDRVALEWGQTVQVARSCYSTAIIKTNKYSFYDILRQKMLYQ